MNTEQERLASTMRKEVRAGIKADLIITYLNNQRKMVSHISDKDYKKIRERIVELISSE